MGANSSQSESRLFNWVMIQPHRYINTSTQEIIDHRQVVLSSQISINSYSERIKIIKPNIVQLLYFKKKPPASTIFVEKKHSVDVYVEGGLQNLELFLRQHKNTHNMNCYCPQVIKGFQILKEFYGPFQINSSMIWFDRSNQIKVWVNQNYFINELKPAKQSLMVLQIKQILLKLQCKCNPSQFQKLSFNFLKQQIANFQKQTIQLNHDQMPKRSIEEGQKLIINNPNGRATKPFNFFYPNHIKNKEVNYQQICSPIQQHSKKLNNTVNLMGQVKKMNAVSRQIDFQKSKNNSAYISTSYPSTPKICFNYSKQSAERTPNKQFVAYRPYSEFNSPKQFSGSMSRPQTQEYRSGPAFGSINRINQNLSFSYPIKSEPLINIQKQHFDEPKHKYFSNQQHSPTQIIVAPFAISQNENSIKKDVQMQKQVPQIERDQQLIIGNKSVQLMKKISPSQYSFTDRQNKRRQKNSPDSIHNRRSIESDKLQRSQGRLANIQYEMPTKTKKLVQKYLSQGYKSTNENQISYKAKIIHKRQSNPNIKGHKMRAQLRKYEREQLKKQMQMVFSTSPTDEQESKIKKKVAQKKAIFADLKAEAYKILDNKQV